MIYIAFLVKTVKLDEVEFFPTNGLGYLLNVIDPSHMPSCLIKWVNIVKATI